MVGCRRGQSPTAHARRLPSVHTYKQGPLRSIALDHDLPKISIQSSLGSSNHNKFDDVDEVFKRGKKFIARRPVAKKTRFVALGTGFATRDVIYRSLKPEGLSRGHVDSSTTPIFTQRIASGSGAPGANAVRRSRLSASVTGHFSLAAVVWNQVMTVVKGQSQGCLAWVWNSLPLR